MKPSDIKSAPKQFCETVNMGFSEEFFVLSLNSGEDSSVYAFTPKHAKRLLQYLNHQIGEYEEKYAEINTTWKPDILSPMQPSNKPDDLS